ncbi:SDR family NAD(P)-dependent oxidoreductase [Algibacillus agarilyticus]|uniref:SDR family NAD(P)-dependent oxidoreductase n=1 Tax=Algibacillus agarilyticus TaxID=2234133 RepID=UPI000DD03AAE|nr:type I polyketide synthase [Algibacillus agarilyticus]
MSIDNISAEQSPTKRALQAIQKLQKKLDTLEQAQVEPIAIVGMSCRFPGDVNTPEAYWQLLCDGKDATTEVPSTRWDVNEFYDPNPDAPGKTYAYKGGFVNNIDQFDPVMFGISPREAASIDPQHRMLLELAWQALENANIPTEDVYNQDTGVFVGMTSTEYCAHLLWSGDTSRINAYAGTGGSLGVAAGRLSYTLGLKGPSLVVDTACSSSLVTTHLACQSLRAGECNVAISAGINLMLGPETFVNFSKAKMLAPDGRCKTFDASADGYARGEGGGVIVLKRLSDAEQNGDNILAVIRGSAVNQDGPSGGLTVPNGPAQVNVIKKALKSSKINPEQVGYVEAHGTGTALGDPIEMSALNSAYGEQRPNALWVGSVKTNFGHLESAAGIAGLIKSVLMLKHGQIPPHLHFNEPSPHIPWQELAVKIPTKLQSWDQKTRYTGVSSFSFSGTNAHIILGTRPEISKAPVSNPLQNWRILPISAKDERSLNGLKIAWQNKLKTSPSLNQEEWAELARTSVSGRTQLPYRTALIGNSTDAILQRLKLDNLPTGRVSNSGKEKIAFIFTGQGSQFRSMGQELYRESTVFKEALDACDGLLKPILGHSLISLLYAEEEKFESLLNITAFTQPILFSIEYALTQLWQSWGIKPDAVLGHSVGEYAAACCAGVFSLEDAISLISERGRLMQERCEPGAMVSVPLSEQVVLELIKPWGGELSIASINGPNNVVVSCEPIAAAAFADALKASSVEPQLLKVSHAFHSNMMGPMLSPFSNIANSIRYNQPSIDVYSTLTGEKIDLAISKPNYWVEHVESPVRFSQGIQALINDGYTTFVEVGPKPTLCSLGKQICDTLDDDTAKNCVWLPSLRASHSPWATILQSLGHLWTLGLNIKWSELNGTGPAQARLPNYAFQRSRYWIDWEIGEQSKLKQNKSAHILLGERLNSPAFTKNTIVFNAELDPATIDLLAHHKIFNQIVLPAAAHLEIVLAAAAQLWSNGEKDKFAITVMDVAIEQALILSEEKPTSVQLVLNPANQSKDDISYLDFNIYSLQIDGNWQSHTSGKLQVTNKETAVIQKTDVIDLHNLQTLCDEQLSVDEYYKKTHEVGIEHGTKFQALNELWQGKGMVLAKLALPETVSKSVNDFLLHPVILDAAFQMVGVPLLAKDSETPYLPVGMAALHRYQATGKVAWCIVKPQGEANSTYSADIELIDESGNILVKVDELRYQRVSKHALVAKNSDRYTDWLYQTNWVQRVGYQADAAWLPPIESLANKLDKTMKHVAEQVDWYGDLFVALDDLVAVYAYEAFQQLGLNWVIGKALTLNKIINELAIIPDYHKLLGRLLTIMTEQGQLEKSMDNWLILTCPPRNSEELVDDIVDQFPHAQHEIALVRQCGKSLAQALTGQIEGLQLLFPNGNADLVTRFYTESPGPQEINKLLQQTLHHAIKQLPEGQGVRILEIGGGTGSSTQHLLSLLPKDRCQYVFTDVSAVFITKAQEKFSHFDFIEYKVLDIEQSPINQGIDIASFDIIIAANVLHATKDLNQTLTHVNQLLVPGGQLLLLEGTSPQPWLDITFGLTEGWWRFSDEKRRNHYPLINIENWQKVLAECSFEKMIEISPDKVANKDLCRQAVIVANKAIINTNENWLIIADKTGLGSSLANRITASGGNSYLLADDKTVNNDNLRHCLNGCDKLDFIVHTRSLGAKNTDELDAETLIEAQELGCKSVLDLLNTLEALQLSKPPRLVLLSNMAVNVDIEHNQTLLNLSQSSLWAMGQVIKKEYPELKCRQIDLGCKSNEFNNCINTIWQEIAAQTTENVALRKVNDQFYRYVPRLASLSIEKPTQAEIIIRDNATYLITGGLGDLGLLTAHWLVKNKGVKHIVLAGRKAATLAVEKQVATLESLGANVQMISADITDSHQVNAMIESITQKRKLAGVIHAAGTMDDGVLASMTWPRFKSVLAPKTVGAWNLHQACINQPLDFFIMYSSAASLLGPTAQANYAAANGFLDQLASFRQNQNLPAMTINWGAWSSIGLAAQVVEESELDARGMASIKPEEGLSILEILINKPQTQVLVADIDWPKMLMKNPQIDFFEHFENFENFHDTVDIAIETSLFQQLQNMPASEQNALVTDLVKQQLVRVLALESIDLIDEELGFFEMGMDSLTAVELRNALQNIVKQNLPTTLLFKYPTVSVLVLFLIQDVLELTDTETKSDEFPLTTVESDEPTMEATNTAAKEISDMSDDELAAMIDAELGDLGEFDHE